MPQKSLGPRLGHFDTDKYIKYDSRSAADRRYCIQLLDGTWRPIPATDRAEAREILTLMRPVRTDVHTSKPYGQRPEVDPMIVAIPADEMPKRQAYYGVIVSDTFVKQDLPNLDAARAYAYKVFVKNKAVCPANLETLKALHRLQALNLV